MRIAEGGCSSRVDESAGFPAPAGGLCRAWLQAGGSGSQLVPQPSSACSRTGADS